MAKVTEQMTAAEWLIEQIKNNHNICYRNITKQQIEQAKQMEKEQIMDAYIEGGLKLSDITLMSAEDYYNDTYTQSGTEQD